MGSDKEVYFNLPCCGLLLLTPRAGWSHLQRGDSVCGRLWPRSVPELQTIGEIFALARGLGNEFDPDDYRRTAADGRTVLLDLPLPQLNLVVEYDGTWHIKEAVDKDWERLRLRLDLPDVDQLIVARSRTLPPLPGTHPRIHSCDFVDDDPVSAAAAVLDKMLDLVKFPCAARPPQPWGPATYAFQRRKRGWPGTKSPTSVSL